MTRGYSLGEDQWEHIQNLLSGYEKTVDRSVKNKHFFVFVKAVL